MSTHSDVDAVPRRRLSADDRRSAILQAARPVFARIGYHGASTAEIASAADCSEPTLYKHFPSKQALFAAVVESCSAEMRQLVLGRLEAAADPLAEYIALMREKSGKPQYNEMVRVRSLAVALVDQPEIREAVRVSIEGQRATVAALVRTGQERGQVRADVDADTFAWIMVGVGMVGGFRYAIEGAEGLARMPEVHETMMRLLEPPPALGGAAR